MSRKEFRQWRKNGNFTISQNRILQVTNDISEGMHDQYTKEEAAQAVTYWSLSHSGLVARFNNKQLRIALELMKGVL